MKPTLAKYRWNIGIDVGGTFTDMVLLTTSGKQHTFKVPSVPDDPSTGVMHALNTAAQAMGISLHTLLSSCRNLIHGSTIATNTLLESKGARVGLLTTEGFRDTLEIRRGYRRDVWNHREPFAPVLVPRYLRRPVRGRIDVHGRELRAFEESDVRAAAYAFEQEGVEAIAVCLMHAWRNPDHELRAKEGLLKVLAGKEVTRWISLSSEICPMIGEYARSSTTVINAYLSPRVSSYLLKLADALTENGLASSLLIQQSNGGVLSVGQAVARPVNLLLSGPAAGVGALNHLSESAGTSSLIAMEIGGTSTDVTIMNQGHFNVTEDIEVAGYTINIPAVEIHTVGAGGGSIASVDAGGMMSVGPDGAGAHPGPAAYGRGGTAPTVTDAHLCLGRLRSGQYADGHVTLVHPAAAHAIESKLAVPLAISADDAAIGILKLANQRIRQAVERISVERGIDARRFALVACGGAGPMHGAAVARELGISTMIVPRQSGAFCAFGMLNTDIRNDSSKPCLKPLNDNALSELRPEFSALEKDGMALLEHEGFTSKTSEFLRELNLRHVGQQWDIAITLETDDDATSVRKRFETQYQTLYGHLQPNGRIEICSIRSIAIGRIPRVQPTKRSEALQQKQTSLPVEHRRVYFEGSGWHEAVPVFPGPELSTGFNQVGPAIIDEATTTIVVGPGDEISIDPYGDYRIEICLLQEVQP